MRFIVLTTFVIINDPEYRKLFLSVPLDVNGGSEKHLIDLEYDEHTPETLKATLSMGDLTKKDWIQLDFEDHDILCLETLRLSDPNSNAVLNIIQDYDAHAWDVKTGNQDWESATGRKITYFSNNCKEDFRMLSKVS